MILTEEQSTEIKGAIEFAVERLYQQDFSLLEREAHERSCAFRFGIYFTESIAEASFGADTDLTIDFDYNRNLRNVKKHARL